MTSAAGFIEERDREMDRLGVDRSTSTIAAAATSSTPTTTAPAVREFLRSELMARDRAAALGDTVYLFNEQYVVKAAERGMRFGWHQDSGFIGYPHPPYLTCWIALDDVDEANGTVYLLPYARAGTRDVVEHVATRGPTTWSATSATTPATRSIVPAGSIACFSSTVFHRSGPNTTDRPRRIYVAQYSAEPILDEEGSRPRHLAEPLAGS